MAQLRHMLPPLASASQSVLLPLTLILTAVVLVQCVVGMSPDIYWDVDPRSVTGAADVLFMGPAGAACLQLVSVAVAGVALLAHVLAGGTLRWGSFILAGLGAVTCVIHFGNDAEDMRRGMSWVAAVSVAIAVVHLGSRVSLRQWMCAALVAMLVPLLLRSLLYVWLEHPLTVAMYTKDEASILAGRGWEPGSPQHLAYTRRIVRPDVTGVFALSNVFGSVVMALTLIAATNLIGVVRRSGWRRSIMPTVLAVSGLIMVCLTRSRGAVAALLVGSLLVVLCMTVGKRPWGKRIVAVGALVLISAVILTVLVRGVAGPPRTSSGELSILFRFQYWQGALRMVMDRPMTGATVGVGPGSFQERYMAVKSPVSPEEVTSAHNVFVDFITMLGLGGWAWSLLLLTWIWQAGLRSTWTNDERFFAPSREKFTKRSRDKLRDLEPNSANGESTAAVLALLLALLIFGTQFVFHLPALTPESLVVSVIGVVAFVVFATRWVHGDWSSVAGTSPGLFVAATALLVHNQIEMSFFHQGASTVVWFIVALAASSSGRETIESGQPATLKRGRLFAPVALLVGAGFMAVCYVAPVKAQQAALRDGAVRLRQGDIEGAIDDLDAAIEALATDARSYRSRARLLLEMVMRHAQAGRLDLARRDFARLLSDLDEAFGRGLDSVPLIRLRALAYEHAAEFLQQPIRLHTALDVWHRVTARSPYSLQDHIRLADLQWRLKKFASAAITYKRCLTLSEQAYLDPTRQLPAQERQRIRQRIDRAREEETVDSQ